MHLNKELDTLLFVGRPSRNDGDGLRPVAIKRTSNDIDEIMSPGQFKEMIGPVDIVRIRNTDSDRAMNRIVFNSVKPVDDGAISELIVFDRSTRTRIFSTSVKRYHTHASISPDGRYLASYSHPPHWIRENPWNEDLKAWRVDVYDLDTSTHLTIADDCLATLLTSGRGFYWNQDSDRLVFLHVEESAADSGARLILQMWQPAIPAQRTILPLAGNRRFVESVHFLEDDRLIIQASSELFLVKPDFIITETLYVGAGLHDINIENSVITLYDQEGKPGKGKLVEVPIPLDSPLSN